MLNTTDILKLKKLNLELLANARSCEAMDKINENLVKLLAWENGKTTSHFSEVKKELIEDAVNYKWASDLFIEKYKTECKKPQGTPAMFAKLALLEGIKFTEICQYIDCIQSGKSISERLELVGNFMGMKKVFWNPATHLDYNFFVDNQAEIKQLMD